MRQSTKTEIFGRARLKYFLIYNTTRRVVSKPIAFVQLSDARVKKLYIYKISQKRKRVFLGMF
jgi:hypothetical protein